MKKEKQSKWQIKLLLFIVGLQATIVAAFSLPNNLYQLFLYGLTPSLVGSFARSMTTLILAYGIFNFNKFAWMISIVIDIIFLGMVLLGLYSSFGNNFILISSILILIKLTLFWINRKYFK